MYDVYCWLVLYYVRCVLLASTVLMYNGAAAGHVGSWLPDGAGGSE